MKKSESETVGPIAKTQNEGRSGNKPIHRRRTSDAARISRSWQRRSFRTKAIAWVAFSLTAPMALGAVAAAVLTVI